MRALIERNIGNAAFIGQKFNYQIKHLIALSSKMGREKNAVINARV